MDNAFNSTDDMKPVCNVTSITTYIQYRTEIAIPSTCTQSVVSGDDTFDIDEDMYLVLAYSYHRFDQLSTKYYSMVAHDSCLINTHLNCTFTAIITPSDFSSSSEEETIHLLSFNVTLQRDEYILYTDGTAQVCSYPPPTSTESQRSALDITAAVCGWLSVLALIATLITYMLFASLRNLAGKAVINLVIALLFAYIGLLLAGLFQISATACAAWATVTHFFWIAAFTWMMLFAFNIARTFSRRGLAARGEGEHSLWKYMCLGWTIPTVIIVICLGLHFCDCASVYFHYGNVDTATCFLVGPNAVLYAFVIPISVLLALSISFFVFMAIQLRRQRNASKFARTGGTVEESSSELIIYLRVRV